MSLRTHVPAVLAAVAALLPALSAAPVAAEEPIRAITHVKGDVWRFQNNFHFSVFAVTEEGVVVTDPINAEAASWLEAEVERRFDRPVVALVWSHSHDHAAGGAVFADTAVTIAQEAAPEAIDGVPVEVRFSERMSFRLGGHSFELTALGPGHGSDMLAMVIRPENVAFVVDVVSPGRLPYRDFPRTDIEGLIAQIRAVEALDFEILAPGHSRLGTRADATEARRYVEWLKDAVAAELRAGRPVEEIVVNLDTSAWAHMHAYDMWRELNIEGMARWLTESGAVQ